MVSASARNGRGQLDIDGVLGTSLTVWPRLMLAFGPIYALQVLPDILQDEIGTQRAGALWIVVVADLLGLLISIVCLGGLTAVATQVLNGGQPRILDAIEAGMRRFFPLLGVCLLAGLVMMGGFMLLVVPGFVATTWYFLVVPVCVLEGAGPRASLMRSAALSKGVRWRIFALFAVVAAAGLVALGCTHVAGAQIGGIWAAGVNVLASTGAGIFAGTVAVVAYRALNAPGPAFGPASETGRFGDV